MKRFFFISIVATLLAFTSCKKDNALAMDPVVQHIPSDATAVSIIRVPQLLEKINFEELKQMNFYQRVIHESDPLMKKVLENPEESGIDLSKNFYSFSEVNPNNMNDMVNGLMVNVADPVKFQEWMKATPLSIGARDKGSYQYTTNKELFLAWNEEMVFIGSQNGNNLETHLDKIFNLEEGASVLGTSGFEEAGASGNDFSFWMNTNVIAENQQAAFGAAMLGYSSEDLKGNYIHGGANFDDKKMTIKMNFILKKILETDLNMPFKSNVSTDFSPYIPAENLTSVFVMGFDLKGLNQLLKEKGMQGMLANQLGLNQLGLNVDEVANAIDGDMMLAIQKQGSDGKPAGIFSITINEKEFTPFLDKLKEMRFLTPEGEGIYKINDKSASLSFHQGMGGLGEANDARMIIKDGKLFFTGDQVLLDGIKNGGLSKSARMDKSIYNSISSGFIGAKGFPEQLKDVVKDLGIEEESIESFIFTGEKGNLQLELHSKEEGNFLKNLIIKNVDKTRI